MQDRAEDQRRKIGPLESALVILGEECNAADARVSDLLSGNNSMERVLSSLALPRASAYERERTIARLGVEKAEAVAHAPSKSCGPRQNAWRQS